MTKYGWLGVRETRVADQVPVPMNNDVLFVDTKVINNGMAKEGAQVCIQGAKVQNISKE